MNICTLSQPPTGPGQYFDVSAALYHSGPGVSKSQLDHLNNAPALIEWSKKAPRDEDATAGVDMGETFHTRSLEPDRYSLEYAPAFVAPKGAIVTTDDLKAALDERGIAYTSKDTKPTLTSKLLDMDPEAPVLDALQRQWSEEVRGRTVLSQADERKVSLMHRSAMAHPFARALLEAPGEVESSIYWIDPETGLLCRIRPDKIVRLNGLKIMLDVKTCADVDRFDWSIEDYRYHVTDAFYTEGFTQHFGEPPDAFVFLVVSTTRNAGRYPVRCFQLDADDKIAGRNAFRQDLNTYAECQSHDLWPGVETIARPERARRADVAA